MMLLTLFNYCDMKKMKEKYLADMAKPGPCSGIQFEKDKITLTLDHCEDGWELIKLNALEVCIL